MIDNLKLILGIKDSSQDELLNLILEQTEARLCSKISQSEVPDELKYIVLEVAIIRFNKIGSEGVSSHSVEGESMTFESDDFSAFEEDIQMWRNKEEEQTVGKIVFL